MKRDLFVFGGFVTAAGIVVLLLVGWSYVNGTVAFYQACTGGFYNSVACQTAVAQNSLTTYWILAGLAVFIIGLWSTARAFMTGEDLLAPRRPPPMVRMCPVCKTVQDGPFCGNDGTKLQ